MSPELQEVLIPLLEDLRVLVLVVLFILGSSYVCFVLEYIAWQRRSK